jgi:hypothetical protein
VASKLWNWAKENKTPAIIIVLALSLAFASAGDGWSARRVAIRYLDLAKGWAAAYQRDTVASKKEYEKKIKGLTDERNAYKKSWEEAKGKMNAPWIPPKGAKELQERFNKHGYVGALK